ncbi:hypothetical protein ABZS68_32875 [Streptomyces sp. NPDC005571]|uniref:hypothetical protein n=1 Tax=Streptomyces sp. NPDC005571 TaxID=3156888 RepID=UPI0033B6E2AA
MGIAIAKLETWMRDYYHKVDHDIGSSGVRDLSMAELRALFGFELSALNPMVLRPRTRWCVCRSVAPAPSPTSRFLQQQPETLAAVVAAASGEGDRGRKTSGDQ